MMHLDQRLSNVSVHQTYQESLLNTDCMVLFPELQTKSVWGRLGEAPS